MTERSTKWYPKQVTDGVSISIVTVVSERSLTPKGSSQRRGKIKISVESQKKRYKKPSLTSNSPLPATICLKVVLQSDDSELLGAWCCNHGWFARITAFIDLVVWTCKFKHVPRVDKPIDFLMCKITRFFNLETYWWKILFQDMIKAVLQDVIYEGLCSRIYNITFMKHVPK